MTCEDRDESLIEASRSGHTEAYGELVQRYQDRLFPTLLRLTGSAEDARDLLQEAFLRAYQKLAHFHGGSSFYTWLYRLAVNLALSDRRRNRRKRKPRLSELQLSQELEPPDPSSLDGPGKALEASELNAQIQEALNRLSPDYRAVVILKEFDDLSYEEIAETLNIPIGTVRSRLHRARGELRDQLAPLIDNQTSLLRESIREPG